jgi:uncharacterized protein (TIGR03086 family)
VTAVTGRFLRPQGRVEGGVVDDNVELMLLPAVEHALAAAAVIGPDDLRRPTPCSAWTVEDVLVHLLDSFSCLTTALNFGAVPIGADAAPAYGVPGADSLRAAARSLVAAARRSRGPRRIRVADREVHREHLLTVGAVEAAVHGWDLDQGTGRARAIPHGLAVRLLDRVPAIVNRHTRGGAFATPVLVSSESPPADRLLAALGREPGSTS